MNPPISEMETDLRGIKSESIVKRFKHLKFLTVIAALLVSTFFATDARAKTPEEAELVAMRYLGDKMAAWIHGMEPRPESIAIFAVNANAPLDADASRVFETELRKGLSDRGMNKVSTCIECRNPWVKVQDDKIIVSAGVADAETLKRVSGNHNAQTLLVIDLYRTKLKMGAHAQLLDAQSGDMLGVERFYVPALNFADTSAQVLVTFGVGSIFPKPASGEVTPAASASLLEDIGFAKAGLTTGGIISSSNGTLIYCNPSIAFRGSFGNSGLGYSLMFGLGYGFVGSARGLDARVSFDLYLGSWAVFGLEYNYLYSQSNPKPTIPSYGGFHVGVSFGR